jgi:multiple sugar transport system substrate-binding protein
LTAGFLAACTRDGGPAAPPGDAADAAGITVWTTDTLPDRVARTQSILENFGAATGVKVDLVTVPAHRFSQMLTSSAASGDLPDVIGGMSLGQVRTVTAAELMNTDANAQVISKLGEATWSQRSLELTREGARQLAVPGSAWQHVLYYRKDLFAKAGLRTPDTYGNIKAAAERLPSPGMAGIAAANKAGQVFTQQSFEQIAQGNGCEMTDARNNISFDSPQCVGALRFYRDMLANHSVPGPQDTVTVRTAYLTGKAAMAVWPTFMLDELAGLRADAMPRCPECIADPEFLARNTGVVTGILGAGDSHAHFGEVSSWTITKDSDTEHARQLVEFMVSEGYEDWLAMAPEERIPVRAGKTAGSAEYADAWRALPVGVGKNEPLSRIYPQDVLSALLEGVTEMKQWGIIGGRGDLVGAAMHELPVAKAVSDVSTGKADPSVAARTAAASLRAIQAAMH